MTTGIGMRVGLALVTVALAVLSSAGVATANPGGSGDQGDQGDHGGNWGDGGGTSDGGGRDGQGGRAVGHGANPFFTFDFDVRQNSANTRDASGSFQAKGVAPSNVLIDVRGPAVCVDVRDHTAGFLYPIEPGSMPAPFVGRFVLITAQDGGPGGRDAIGFLPVGIDPGSCAPNVASLPVTSGDIVVEPG